MAKVKKYVDDKIEHREDDIDKIKTKPLMYISYAGSRGALHLTKEVINNAIDETINPKSPGNNVSVFFDEKENKISIIDNGRGIPFDKIDLVCTKLQAGSKFNRDADKKGVANKSFTAGENGVGLTAVNALSEFLVFNVFREGKKGTFLYKEGKLASKEIVDIKRGEMQHGTIVSFVPSEKYLGKCKIPLKDILQWVTDLGYLIDPSISLTFSYVKSGSDVVKTQEFNHENGMKVLLEEISKKRLVDPICVGFRGSYKIEESGDVTYDTNENTSIGEDIVIQAAFTINPDIHLDEPSHYKSFCNFINTIDHGVHLDACKTAWCQLITKLANESLSESESKKLNISFEDCRNGLFATVNIMCDNPQFASQTKEKISNNDLYKPIRKIVYMQLFKFFKENPSLLKKIISFVKTNARSRLELGKIRKSEFKPTDNLSEHTLACFNPANGDGYRELFIVEGKSAKGSLDSARDAKTQALFSLRGVPKNSFGLKLVELLANQEFKYLIKILGCGIGKDFNIDKLRYDKIIIFTDSDIDGFRIASLLCTFFLTQYPEIVKRGILYKAVAPLYLIEDPKKPYILNKIEYYEYFADKLIKHITMKDNDGVEFKPSQLKRMIIANNQYLSSLNALVNYYAISPDIIEFLVENYEEGISEKAFNKVLKKKFKEMVLEDGVVKGVHEGSYQYITLDKTFYKRSRGLHKLIKDNGVNSFSITDGNFKMDNVTFGAVLRYAKKYMPVTKSRLKGLGEMDPSDLWASSLNPKTRELIQLTSDDIELELERFQTLHGKDADARRELMKEYILDINDIDN